MYTFIRLCRESRGMFPAIPLNFNLMECELKYWIYVVNAPESNIPHRAPKEFHKYNPKSSQSCIN